MGWNLEASAGAPGLRPVSEAPPAGPLRRSPHMGPSPWLPPSPKKTAAYCDMNGE